MAISDATVRDVQDTIVLKEDYPSEVAEVVEGVGGPLEIAVPEFREILT